MKLLDKKQIDLSKSLERKREIDEGIKLAKKVDALRELTAKEQKQLQTFREQSLNNIKAELDPLINEINRLKKQRQELENPVDLKEVKDKLELDKKSLEVEKQSIRDREMEIIVRETAIKNFFDRETALQSKEKKAEDYLNSAHESYKTVEILRLEMESKKEQAEKEISKRLTDVTDKERDLSIREDKLAFSQNKVSKEKEELLHQGTNLISRESIVEAKTKELFERDEKLREQENLTLRYNQEAANRYGIADKIKLEIEKVKSQTDKDIASKYEVLNRKEKEVGYRERDLILQKEQVEKDRQDIEKEKLHIASQQETLKVAWLNIKKLKK